MRISILAALIATSALVPAMASAQDRPDGPRGGGEARPARPAGAPPRPQGGGQRPAAVAPQHAPAAAAPAQPARPAFNRSGDPQGGARPPQAQFGQRPQAQNGRDGLYRGNGGAPNRGGFNGGGAPAGNPAGNPGAVNQQQRAYGQDRGANQPQRGFDQNRGGNRGGPGRPGGFDTNNRGNGQAWNRGWRGNNQYDWQRYRESNRQLYRLPRYYAPYGYGYGYRRYGIGAYLNELLFDQSYWINDPNYYHLPPAYGPYRWVRYYNDALLVNIYTGEVVDEIPGLFW